MGNTPTKENNFNYFFNVYPDPPDYRDKKEYIIDKEQLIKKNGTPIKDLKINHIIDLRNDIDVSSIYSMGDMSTSISSSISSIIYSELVKLKEILYYPSRLFIHNNTNNIENISENSNNKQCIRNALKSVKRYGVCNEKSYEYNMDNLKTSPTQQLYTDASKITINYFRIKKNIKNIVNVLLNKKLILINISIFSSFFNDSVRYTGRIPYPDSNDSFIGMISAVIVGYIEKQEVFILRMNFGNLWGDHGYAYISINYLLNLGCDFWFIDVLLNKIVDKSIPKNMFKHNNRKENDRSKDNIMRTAII